MKKVFYAVFAAIVVTLSACGGAHAAPANDCFTANPATTLFCTGNAAKVAKVGSGIEVTTEGLAFVNGTVTGYGTYTTVYADPTGSVWTSFKAQAAANDFYATSTAQTTYLSARNASDVSCLSGSISQFKYKFGAENTAPEACAAFYAFKTRVNP